jgi:hypothetical protein
MKNTLCLTFAALALILFGSGCGSLRVIEGSMAPPAWVTDYSMAADFDPKAYVYASGMSTYAVVLEDGINDARHDAIRKIVEQIGIAAEDTYRTDRTDKQGVTQTGMPNIPQSFMNSGAAVSAGQTVEARRSRTPHATHVSQTRIHGIESSLVGYTVWYYTPGVWSRMFDADTAVRYYDVYVLIRCPRAEFENAVKTDKKWDDAAELVRPSSLSDKK